VFTRLFVHLPASRVKIILVDLNYVFNFLLTPKLNDKYKELMVGFNSPSITNEQFEKTLIPLPSLAEQNHIVRKLDEANAVLQWLGSKHQTK